MDLEKNIRGEASLATAPSVASLDQRHKLGLLAIERTRVPMVVTDPRQPDNPIVLANQSFLEMTGYSDADILGRNCRFLQGADTDPHTVNEIRAAVAEGREITTEILNYHRDGRPFWNQLLVSPVFDEDGALIFFFASQIDVSARRAAQDLEAAEHLLLKEVDHRAKNALALVQSIVRLTRSDDAGAYARTVQGRVDALARAHALLADGRWRGVSMTRLVRGALDPFGLQRFQARGPEVQIASSQVQPLSLLLHEMLENASRHGTLSRAGGTVLIDWDLTAEDHLVLKWREVGDGVFCHASEPALGLTMVMTMVERQLRGRSAFLWEASGLEAEFVFPMARSTRQDNENAASAGIVGPPRGTPLLAAD